MPAKKVTLYVRPTMPDGSRPFLKPAYTSKNNLRHGFALIKGEAQPVNKPAYYISYLKNGTRTPKLVGKDAGAALDAVKKITTRLAAIAAGNTVEDETQPVTVASPKVTEAVEKYLDSVAEADVAANTLDNYRDGLTRFTAFLGQPFNRVKPKDKLLDEVTSRDLVGFNAHLRNNGYAKSSRRTYLIQVHTFLRWAGRKDLLEGAKLPKITKKKVKAFSEGELDRFFVFCDADELLLFHFFLASGYRRSEVHNAAWVDLDFEAGTVTVQEHADFTPKDYEEREIRLPDSLIDALRAWRERNPDSVYIFGQGTSKMRKPDARLKHIALRAGINCGQCTNKAGQSCREHPCCEKVHLHRFRRTFGTRLLRKGVDLVTIKDLYGHSSLETTRLYLEAELAQSPSLREKINAAFGSMVMVGGAA